MSPLFIVWLSRSAAGTAVRTHPAGMDAPGDPSQAPVALSQAPDALSDGPVIPSQAPISQSRVPAPPPQSIAPPKSSPSSESVPSVPSVAQAYPLTAPLPIAFAEAAAADLRAWIASRSHRPSGPRIRTLQRRARRFLTGFDQLADVPLVPAPVPPSDRALSFAHLSASSRRHPLAAVLRVLRRGPFRRGNLAEHGIPAEGERVSEHSPSQHPPLQRSPSQYSPSQGQFLSEPPHSESFTSSSPTSSALFSTPTPLSSLVGDLEPHLLRTLHGRSLFAEEVRKALSEEGVPVYAHADVLLDPLVHLSMVERVPGVEWISGMTVGGGTWRCNRCLSQAIGFYPCPRCGMAACPQCDSCSSLGRSTACLALYHRGDQRGGEKDKDFGAAGGSIASVWTPSAAAGVKAGKAPVTVSLPFEMTESQREISDGLVRAKGDVLVWAACGAGKTETTFAAMRTCLEEGGRVLFAVPRRDVVSQLARRIEDAFTGVDVVPLYGGTPAKYRSEPLVVSTVHQAVRFRHSFDLVIVDEVDAFPLNREPWLLQALERATAPGGRRIYMTATPPDSLVGRDDAGRIPYFVLPARPHGYPLPVPTVRLCKGLSNAPAQRGAWCAALCDILIDSVASGRRALVFVPSIATGSALLELLGEPTLRERLLRACSGTAQRAATFRVEFVHAQDQRRAEKVEAAERGEIRVLLATTVLERGVTLPKVDVVVFGADQERVFAAATLVQMAGRLGRKSDDPKGSACFFAERTTPAMREAVDAVVHLNRAAANRGLLKDVKGESQCS